MFAIISNVCVNAQVSITADATIVRGKTDALTVKLDNTVDVNGLQFILTVPKGVTIETAKPYKPQISDRTGDFSITSKIQEDGSVSFMIVSLEKSIIEPGEGTIMTIYLTSDKDIEYGTYYSEIRDIFVSHSDYQRLELSPVTWKCTITEDVEVNTIHSDEMPDQTYRLDGVHTDKIQNGIHIIRTANGTKKVNIR